MATFSPTDEYWMRHALNLAWKGQYSTTPNPRVGCVFVRDGVAIAEGFHAKAGEGHAEVQAIADSRARGVSLTGSTAYVTLEPCAHHGRTGPCAEALVATGVQRVVAAVLDPNPLVAGKGMAILQAAGIETSHGVLVEEARWINRGFFSRMERQRPWVRLKVASSADGISALNNGASQWITGEAARLHGHHLRAQACAVLSGIGTVKADNPQLNVRGIDTERQPLKVIVDSKLEISPDARLLQTGRVLIAHTEPQTPAWLLTHPNAANIEALNVAPVAAGLHAGKVKTDLLRLLQELAQRGINELHLEAGFGLNGSFLQAGVVDEIVQYIAPRFLGPGQGLFRLPELEILPAYASWAIHSFEQIGQDLRITWVQNNQE
ncbi:MULTISPECIES: bifunctional diaminohydroxyphosphoribosylaminopyrimidine deaminase/5-amino-6-(5-phosphoribosylamino)uracil reductase RibD [unclassified Limnobacter]|uniref:bifunctional diaminohydroxyphosphoribosylaminopyrimidine deaminase/5-amino-6-(5-phosphoribosylamino)uracil reductase RibD n=1 Tax=unclassified Limnobacter TaxID=2630203 RepID=UPI000C40AE1C|nr:MULTISPECIES: bifunctional diaminohydroxyphosphoribosylaminopyrimidine deaminase/5-amino-6-(5-phosphoribosylamino)uracil reductase RibD [unclassified Limnobacter]MAG81185.1 riboflavin biosynthesis protein RibD [Sutterellaceae bacterium]MBT84899.1 riboflavin biosynthesis protein RibD [Sutterellaceae bacterium]HAV75298.1 bifunctional diaminohydroxyphosphoribosylaminopyrimidine deaminase/5-amino-6-(5-phosphoribosylamino)uracil reductase RibD [Limnobacter sp.]|tara:strand:- start:12340 stop:13473 length:1134 start_codon:yes stop_codon:yes gene_type:complete